MFLFDLLLLKRVNDRKIFSLIFILTFRFLSKVFCIFLTSMLHLPKQPIIFSKLSLSTFHVTRYWPTYINVHPNIVLFANFMNFFQGIKSSDHSRTGCCWNHYWQSSLTFSAQNFTFYLKKIWEKCKLMISSIIHYSLLSEHERDLSRNFE